MEFGLPTRKLPVKSKYVELILFLLQVYFQHVNDLQASVLICLKCSSNIRSVE